MFCIIIGEFADVYKGTLKTRNGRDVVAVKVLRVSLIGCTSLTHLMVVLFVVVIIIIITVNIIIAIDFVLV